MGRDLRGPRPWLELRAGVDPVDRAVGWRGNRSASEGEGLRTRAPRCGCFRTSNVYRATPRCSRIAVRPAEGDGRVPPARPQLPGAENPTSDLPGRVRTNASREAQGVVTDVAQVETPAAGSSANRSFTRATKRCSFYLRNRYRRARGQRSGRGLTESADRGLPARRHRSRSVDPSPALDGQGPRRAGLPVVLWRDSPGGFALHSELAQRLHQLRRVS